MGLFVFLAAALMVAGFCYYLYRQAQRRGWFEVKAHYYTYADSGQGLAVGDPVKLMGFEVGNITRIFAMPARGKGSGHNVEIDFEVVGVNYSYIWTNSTARLLDSGFLGKREMDINKGTQGYTAYATFPFEEKSLESITNSDHFDRLRLAQELYDGTNLVLHAWMPFRTNIAKISGLGISELWTFDTTRPGNRITAVWDDTGHRYVPFEGTNLYMLTPEEPPSLMDRAQALVGQVEVALPNISQTDQSDCRDSFQYRRIDFQFKCHRRQCPTHRGQSCRHYHPAQESTWVVGRMDYPDQHRSAACPDVAQCQRRADKCQ